MTSQTECSGSSFIRLDLQWGKIIFIPEHSGSLLKNRHRSGVGMYERD